MRLDHKHVEHTSQDVVTGCTLCWLEHDVADHERRTDEAREALTAISVRSAILERGVPSPVVIVLHHPNRLEVVLLGLGAAGVWALTAVQAVQTYVS